MAFNLHNRSFVKEIDFEPRELRFLLQLSEALKMAKYAGTEAKRIEGKEVASSSRRPRPVRARPSRSQRSTRARM